MHSSSSCPRCSAPLRPDASPAGLCPGCLIASVLQGEGPDDDTDDGSDTLLLPGAMLGAFRIVAPLGRGGMATVYEAYDTRLERTVALKVLPPHFLHDRSFARRFEQEARVIARLEHPAIVTIYASGTDDGIPWMSMRLLAGGNMGTLLERAPLDPVHALRILGRVAEALDHAHAHGVVHRDVKPTNILFDGDGHPLVGDFGLAQMLEGNATITRTGTVIGTPSYMAPEQALGKGVDRRCDIYSLGIVAYEMLVGTTPFTDESPVAVLLKHVNEPLPVSAAGALPASAVRAIQRAAAKDPAERWPSASAFVDALVAGFAVASSVVGVVSSHDEPTSRGRLWAWSRRYALALTALMGTAALAVAAVTWTWRSPASAPRATMEPAVPVSTPVPPLSAVADGQAVPSPVSAPTPPSSRRRAAVAPGPAPPSLANDPSEDPARVPVVREPASSAAPEAPPTVTAVAPAPGQEPQPPGAAEPQNEPRVLQAPPPVADGVVIPPRRTGIVEPIYPDVAKAARLEGDVLLRVTVSADGSVASVLVLRSPHRSLNAAATEAVRRSRYSPGSRNGVPEEATTNITVRFRLD